MQKFKGSISVENELNLPNQSNSKALELDASGNVSSSSVTSTELSYLSGVTSALQTQLNNKQDKTPTGKTLYADSSRVDVYTEDGTEEYPFKDPNDALAQIVTNGDNSTTVPYTIILKQGTYGTITLSDPGLVWVNLVGLSGVRGMGVTINAVNFTGINLYRGGISNAIMNSLTATSTRASNVVSVDNSYIYTLNVSNISDFEVSNTEILTVNLTNAPFVFFQAGYLGITGITTLVNSNLVVQSMSFLNSVSVDATSGLFIRNGVRMTVGTLTINGTAQAYGAYIGIPITINAGGSLLNRGSFIDPANISGAGTYTQQTSAQMIGYTPTTSGNWNTVPTQSRGALDTLASSGIVKSQTQNIVLASPDSSSGVPSFRALVSNDLPSSIPVNKLAALTANRALASDGSGVISASSVTDTELGYVSGVTSSIQTQLGNKQDTSEKAQPNGYASLDAGGKIPASQLPNSVMELQGEWNASTNTPTLADGVGNPGDVYEVTVAGTQNLGSGSITYAVGDWAVYSASGVWYKSLNSNDVTSVNGQIGTVVLDTDDVNEGVTNLYFTDERAQDAIGNNLLDTASVNLTYNDGTGQISADVLPAGVDHDQLQNFVANEHIDHSTVQIQTAADSGLSGGGDLTTTRSLVVDINGTTAETVPANGDEILIYDVSALARRKMTRSNFLSGIALSSPGDLSESSFSGANNQVTAANVTGFAFSTGVVQSFEALVDIVVDATTPLEEQYKINGRQKGGSFFIEQSSIGDNSQVLFTITSGGQIQYTSGNYAGFVSLTIRFRAITLSV